MQQERVLTLTAGIALLVCVACTPSVELPPHGVLDYFPFAKLDGGAEE